MRLVQVIPTVGVDKDENGKSAASQLKHFRNLVDETASKAKFLAGFLSTEAPSLSRRGSSSTGAESGAGRCASGGTAARHDSVEEGLRERDAALSSSSSSVDSGAEGGRR